MKSFSQLRIRFLIISLSFSALFFLGGQKVISSPQEHREEFFQSYPLSPHGSFELQNVNGLVAISTWPESKVEIKAVKKTRRDPKNLKLVRIDVKASADGIKVETIYPRLRNTGVSVDYEIRLPEGLTETGLRVVNGQIQIRGQLDWVKASTVNGHIQAEYFGGRAIFSTVNGGVEASINAGPTKIETVNGNVNCHLLSLTDNLSIETVNGSIEIKMEPEIKLNAYFEAKTTNGSIKFDLPLTFQSFTKSRGSLEGQIGSGGPLVRLRTVNGSIRLK